MNRNASPGLGPSERERIRAAVRHLRAAESGVRLLRSLSWPPEVRERFLARGGEQLPEVVYPPFDPGPVHTQLAAAWALPCGDPTVDRWLGRTAEAIAAGADLLAAAGTPAFLEHGARLFGLPTFEAGGSSALELARTVDAACRELAPLDLGSPEDSTRTAEEVALALERACRRRFGERAPEVHLVDHLSANALAGPRRIQVRRGARFSDLDLAQLVQHEAFVHVCTSLNGLEQAELPILAAAHPGTTRTQEGLAVFAEFITGALAPDRLRRLSDRVLAIQHAIDGADFVEVYRWFLAREVPPEQAFESTRRVFRGGVLSGGAPFTKDVVYLEGLLCVTNFLRVIAAEGRVDCLLLLFAGKLDLEDLPALARLSELGLCRPPRFLPPWAEDRRFLVTYLTYSRFLGTVQLGEQRQRYQSMLAGIPRLDAGGVSAA